MRASFVVLTSWLFSIPRISASPALVRRDADFENVRTRLDRSHANTDDGEPEKYFHESTFHQHYDGRFADKPLPYDERRAHLRSLIQTYLSSINDIGGETWLMHGSLLGWWWNREVLPWDSDLDVMVSEKTLYHLADFHNMTVHRYTVPGSDDGREYLLEINPHYKNNSVESSNKIDARWIDTDTGLFIDITTLRRNETAEVEGADGVMMVKDKHHYLYDDIFPLRQSTFEEFPAMIPFAYADILIEEYGEKALAEVHFAGHHFDAKKESWLPFRYADPWFREAAKYGFRYWGAWRPRPNKLVD